MSLSDSSFAIRTAALKDYEEHVGAGQASELARLDAARTDARERHERDVRDARATFAACTVELEASIASDLQSTLRPLFVEFAAAPSRVIAGDIRDMFRALNARAILELGEPLSFHGVGIALGAAHDMADRMADPYYWRFDGMNQAPIAIAALFDAFVGHSSDGFRGKSDVVCEETIENAERMITSRGIVDQACPDRLAIILSKCTSSATRSALADYDAAGRAQAAPEPTRAMTKIVSEDDPDGLLAISKFRQSGVFGAYLP